MKKGYPRPQLVRDGWVNLNGSWDFKFDDDDQGLENKWHKYFTPDFQINVPFSYETELSGLNILTKHKIMWYHRKFNVDAPKGRVILHFGAVDYRCVVYINGVKAFTHIGGNVSFKGDITEHIIFNGVNDLTLRVYDDMEDLEMPRGKQYWKETSESIYYTRTSGIWQTVWLEEVPNAYIEKIKVTPNIDNEEVNIEYYFSHYMKGSLVNTIIKYKGAVIVDEDHRITGNTQKRIFSVSNETIDFNESLWSPENPNLYDLEICIKDENTLIDSVTSYFGMRKISVDNGRVKLNNKEYYMRLVLDQGYYPKSLLTSPSDEDLINDILITKEMGFNGVRKHQKIEEERYLYYADKYGLLLWEELPSAYIFNKKSKSNLRAEWIEALNRDYNHPCIVAWVPMNESWGVPNLETSKEQSDFLNEMYYLTKEFDDTRIVVSNDGWEHSITDLFTIHDYESNCEVLLNRYSKLENILSSKPGYKPLFNPGYKYEGQPILITEFGGISFEKNGSNGWGYSSAETHDDYTVRLKKVVHPIVDSKFIQGFCYTQLTDVEQEINGLLTYDRKPKISIESIKRIIKDL